MKYLGALILISLMLGSVIAQDAPPPTATTTPASTAVSYFYTYQQISGNRYVPGKGTFPNISGYDITLDSVPAWVVGGNIANDIPRWQVHDALGYSQVIVRPTDSLSPGIVRNDNIEGRGTPASALPVMAIRIGASGNLKSQDNPTLTTHPIPLLGGTVYFQITYNGDVAIWRNDIELSRISLHALLDARPVVSNTGLVAVYVDATDQRYVHGILGDNYEAAGLAVVQLTNQFSVLTRAELQGEDVFEGISPFWADINQDGTDDLVTTVSNSTLGSWIRVYLFDGKSFIGEVNSTPLGEDSRWIHQLAFAPFGPNGEMELVAVRTPEVNGAVQFLRYNAETNALDTVAEIEGYTSHMIGSINTDMAVAGDFNGDGQPEIVLPSQDRMRVASLQHTLEGVREIWSVPTSSRVITNLSAITMPDNTLALAYGSDNGHLSIWLPDAPSPQPTVTPG